MQGQELAHLNAVAIAVALLALVVSGYSAYVARQKLRLDLFDRRYKVFEETWAALSAATQTDALYPPTTLNNVLPIARFLFPQELFDYVNDISTKLGTLYGINMATRSNQGHVPPDRLREWGELRKWVDDQAATGCKDRFQSFSTSRAGSSGEPDFGSSSSVVV